MIPHLTSPQRRLLDSLHPVRGCAGAYRYSTVGQQRGRSLVSCWALWRRGYVATNADDQPDAYERRGYGIVHLTAKGEQLLAAIRKAA